MWNFLRASMTLCAASFTTSGAKRLEEALCYDYSIREITMEQESNFPDGSMPEGKYWKGWSSVALQKLRCLLRETALCAKLLLAFGMVMTILPIAIILLLISGFEKDIE